MYIKPVQVYKLYKDAENGKKRQANELRWLGKAVEQLRAYGLEANIDPTVPRLGTREIDGLIKLGTKGHEIVMVVETKPKLNRANVGQAIERGRNRETLLITNYAPGPIATLLRENRVPFIDLAGNAWIKMPDFLLWVEGRKPTEAEVGTTPRAFNFGGIQLLFALLTNPDWAADTTRQLAEKVRLANGTVAAALRDLEEQGFIIRATPRGKRRLRNTRLLLDKWTEGYLQRFQNKQFYGYYRHDGQEKDWWRKVDTVQQRARLGAEPAAAELTGFLTPGQITFYADMPLGKLIAENKLQRDPGGNVLLRKKFWHFDLLDWPNDRLVPPLLIYADLMGTGEARCIETAGRIRDQYLARLIED